MKAFQRISIIAIICFLIDQATKLYILHILNLPKIGFMTVFSGFNLTMAWNRGINFGIFASNDPMAQYILVLVSLVISIILFVWAIRMNKNVQIGSALVIGGAIGNAFDRLIHNGVADFLNMTCCGFNNPYAFNVADIFIFAGAGILILLSGEEKNKTKDTIDNQPTSSK